jgi:hypothetical protein
MLSPFLTKQALRHEGVWVSGCIDPHFLDLCTSWRWVVSFTPWPLYLRERAPGTHCIGGWVDPRACLDEMDKRKFLPYRDSNPDLSVVQPVASRYTDCAIPAPSIKSDTLIFSDILYLLPNYTASQWPKYREKKRFFLVSPTTDKGIWYRVNLVILICTSVQLSYKWTLYSLACKQQTSDYFARKTPEDSIWHMRQGQTQTLNVRVQSDCKFSKHTWLLLLLLLLLLVTIREMSFLCSQSSAGSETKPST